jgi:hypothetical protein
VQLDVHSTEQLLGVAILLPISPEQGTDQYILDGPGALDVVTRHGVRFLQLTTDLVPGKASWSLTPVPAPNSTTRHD